MYERGLEVEQTRTVRYFGQTTQVLESNKTRDLRRGRRQTEPETPGGRVQEKDTG